MIFGASFRCNFPGMTSPGALLSIRTKVMYASLVKNRFPVKISSRSTTLYVSIECLDVETTTLRQMMISPTFVGVTKERESTDAVNGSDGAVVTRKEYIQFNTAGLGIQKKLMNNVPCLEAATTAAVCIHYERKVVDILRPFATRKLFEVKH